MLIQADARRIPLASGSVHCVVTSPPYFALRDYGVAGQIGLERTPEEYVAALVGVFREVWRVLRDDGTLWLNLGDSYNAYNGGAGPSSSEFEGRRDAARPKLKRGYGLLYKGLKPKDLIGIPWRVAFALQADGWFLRSDIIWHKPNPMPESVADRPTKAHEYLFLLAKSERYFFDRQAIAEPSVSDHGSGNGFKRDARLSYRDAEGARGNDEPWEPSASRNVRSVWSITTKPFPGAHFAVMASEVVERCIRAGTSEKGCCAACGALWDRVTERSSRNPVDYAGKHSGQDPQHSGRRILANVRAARLAGGEHNNPFPTPRTVGWEPGCECNAGDPIPCRVFDPFGGACTTAVVAEGLGRQGIVTELNAEYLALGRRRLERPHAPLPRATTEAECLPLFSSTEAAS